MSFQNIIDAGGIGLSLTGMTIVFVSLVLVSLFISWLPKVLPVVNAILPELEGHHHGVSMPAHAAPVVAAAGGEEEIVAAIGFALHSRGGPSQSSG